MALAFSRVESEIIALLEEAGVTKRARKLDADWIKSKVSGCRVDETKEGALLRYWCIFVGVNGNIAMEFLISVRSNQKYEAIRAVRRQTMHAKEGTALAGKRHNDYGFDYGQCVKNHSCGRMGVQRRSN